MYEKHENMYIHQHLKITTLQTAITVKTLKTAKKNPLKTTMSKDYL